MKRYRLMWLWAALLLVVGLAACSRGDDDATHKLSVSGVYAEVSRVGDEAPVMVVDGVITNDSRSAVQLDELPKLLQDDVEMKTKYEFPYEDPTKLDAGLSVTFHAVAEVDPNASHEWRFEPVEGTEVSGLDESAKLTQALQDYRASSDDDGSSAAKSKSSGDLGDAYTLQEVVVLSRHGVRSPLSISGSTLDIATPYDWTDWSAAGSELTLRGGVAETLMGQYVRTWLEDEELIPRNYQPAAGEVRFCANAKQRTRATAQYFASGMLPVANVTVETNVPYDEMDPLFAPWLTFLSDSYTDAALEQIAERGGDAGMAGVTRDLADAYTLIENLVDYRNSDGYKSGELSDLAVDDTAVAMALNVEPTMTGSLKLANQLADALILQYYETPEAGNAVFGQELTTEQWQSIASVKNRYNEILCTAPLVATNIAHPLLMEIGQELDLAHRKFTFLCGHDCNIASVLAALDVESYELPGTIETQTPLGGFITFEKWANANGDLFGRVRYVYQTTEQLRKLTPLGNGEEPGAVLLSFAGLEANGDGLYAYDDLRGRLAEAEAAYYDLRSTYGTETVAAASLPDAA